MTGFVKVSSFRISISCCNCRENCYVTDCLLYRWCTCLLFLFRSILPLLFHQTQGYLETRDGTSHVGALVLRDIQICSF